jgi:hypothetical protein
VKHRRDLETERVVFSGLSPGSAPNIIGVAGHAPGIRNGGEWTAPRSGRYNSGEIVTSTNWTGGLVDFKCGLDAMEKRDLYCPCCKLNPDSVVVPAPTRRVTGPEGQNRPRNTQWTSH